MSSDVGKATEGLENELWRRWSDGKLGEWALLVTLLILQPFRRFTYITAHSPTLLLLYLRQSSFSNPSVASPMSQFILQPFFCFSYVTGSSLTSRGELPMFSWNVIIFVCHRISSISFKHGLRRWACRELIIRKWRRSFRLNTVNSLRAEWREQCCLGKCHSVSPIIFIIIHLYRFSLLCYIMIFWHSLLNNSGLDGRGL